VGRIKVDAPWRTKTRSCHSGLAPRLRVGLFSPVHLMTTGSVMGGVAGRAWQTRPHMRIDDPVQQLSKEVAYGAILHSHLWPDLAPRVPPAHPRGSLGRLRMAPGLRPSLSS